MSDDAYRLRSRTAQGLSNLISRGDALNTLKPGVMHKDVRATCNHKMGGVGLQGLTAGIGDNSEYSVSKIKLPSGIWKIRCSRCRKVWLPPLRAHFTNLPGEAFDEAEQEYKEALDFPSQLAIFHHPQIRFGCYHGGIANLEAAYRCNPDVAREAEERNRRGKEER